MTGLTDLFLNKGVAEVSGLLAAGEITPEDVRDEVLRAVGTAERTVHAWVVVDPDNLLRDRPWDVDRPYGYQAAGLRGIPFGAKDIFNTKAFPTERGSLAWKGYTPGNNSRVIDTAGCPERHWSPVLHQLCFLKKEKRMRMSGMEGYAEAA